MCSGRTRFIRSPALPLGAGSAARLVCWATAPLGHLRDGFCREFVPCSIHLKRVAASSRTSSIRNSASPGCAGAFQPHGGSSSGSHCSRRQRGFSPAIIRRAISMTVCPHLSRNSGFALRSIMKGTTRSRVLAEARSGMNIDASTDECLHNLECAHAEQRRLAGTIARVDVGARIEQQQNRGVLWTGFPVERAHASDLLGLVGHRHRCFLERRVARGLHVDPFAVQGTLADAGSASCS